MPHSLPQALLIQAQTRNRQIALRYKKLGIWQTRTWGEVAQDVDHLAEALHLKGFKATDCLLIISESNAEALLLALAAQALGGSVSLIEPSMDHRHWLATVKPRYAVVQNLELVAQLSDAEPDVVIVLDDRGLHDAKDARLVDYAELLKPAAKGIRKPLIDAAACAFVFQTPQGEQRLTHADLLNGARQLIDIQAITERDQALAARVFAASGQARYLLAPWLVAGFCLNFPEALSTRDNDRRELGPTLVLGTRESYARLELWARERLPLPGTFAHGLYRWAMAPAQGVIRRQFGYWLIRRPLLDVLGMSRLSKPLLAGEALTPQSHAFFAALGILPRPLNTAAQVKPMLEAAIDGYQLPVLLGASA
ncbi:AMP-binding protein [Pseudomonas viridiflava]|uniref:AMP-binding protein n=1 Tax=Pseudomonas viridiflava TaxID=33069 RepID=A0ABU7N3A7_PSEVI|nr:AMP-binding protein [Pseudomonas viridiflava]MBI6576081.1 AMP-binding protein [Pseudomonas viridiflava]MBI6609310.1 AMP-binding protein [Pseudomonas viridiflava]MBI6637750.1 AMP-binding protein [Pseudomonas viridiflava]MBI6869222.1 AMP-binding protein [Pseudomonas viridiflava]MEE3936249.1 AMP-binding protein [Pseudomonas viridiflava]